jgi:hypothetical protein
MIVHEVKNVRNAQEARVVATPRPECTMGGNALDRRTIRGIVTAIRHD